MVLEQALEFRVFGADWLLGFGVNMLRQCLCFYYTSRGHF